jgi:diacylglycerol kinase family enzyme
LTQPVIQLFVNAQAGSSSRRRVAALQRELETAGARVILTPTDGDSLIVAEDATHVCAVGGDGTLRHVAASLWRSGQPRTMSIFPTGTVNLLAREYGYRRDPISFAGRILRDAAPRLQRIARIGETMMFTCASVGPDSDAVAGLSPRLKRAIGRLAYGVAFLGTVIRWPRPQLMVEADGQTVACEAVYVAKGRYYAGPWSFAPGAAADDPFLHVVAMKRARRRDFVRFLWALLHHDDLARDANLVRFSCSMLRIEGADAPLQADGDIVAALPVEIAIAPTVQPFA